MSVASRDEAAWWESAVIYEIALISFQDSNGDGKGDLAGLMSRIDYLKWLGVDAVWLTPIYKCPFRDLGYALSLQATIDAYLNAIPDHAWPVWVIGGHDKQRIASKIGEPQMRVLAMLLMTLRGTPFFFMGDEIGRKRVPIPPDRVRDPFEKLVPGYGLCRDPERADAMG